MFQNYPKMISNLKELSDIADSSAFSEEIVSYVYKNNTWDNLYEISHILGTISPIHIIGKKGHKKLEYPSSNIKDYEHDTNMFKNDISIMLLINKFKNKLIDEKEYRQELENIKDPVKCFKLANIMKDKKSKEYKNNLSELKKYLTSTN
jgi:hypothetical protein